LRRQREAHELAIAGSLRAEKTFVELDPLDTKRAECLASVLNLERRAGVACRSSFAQPRDRQVRDVRALVAREIQRFELAVDPCCQRRAVATREAQAMDDVGDAYRHALRYIEVCVGYTVAAHDFISACHRIGAG